VAAQVLAMYNTPADPTAFEQYYHGTHIPLAKRLPGLRSYTINRGPLVSPAGAPPYYLIATLSFDSMEAIQAAFASPEGKAAAADIPNFATSGATLLMCEVQNI